MAYVLTAKEIVTAAKLDASLIGKVRCRIAKVPVNKPDSLVNVTGKVEVLLGEKTATVTYEDNPETNVSEAAQAVKKVLGDKATKQVEAIQEAKKPKEKPE